MQTPAWRQAAAVAVPYLLIDWSARQGCLKKGVAVMRWLPCTKLSNPQDNSGSSLHTCIMLAETPEGTKALAIYAQCTAQYTRRANTPGGGGAGPPLAAMASQACANSGATSWYTCCSSTSCSTTGTATAATTTIQQHSTHHRTTAHSAAKHSRCDTTACPSSAYTSRYCKKPPKRAVVCASVNAS